MYHEGGFYGLARLGGQALYALHVNVYIHTDIHTYIHSLHTS